MRFSAGTAANAAAWGVLGALIVAAVLMANRLGFVGLLILGGATALVCTMAELNQDSPTWGAHVFRARMEGGGSPERRAALDAEREAFMSPLRFYRRCGLALVVIGAIGVAWQAWG